MGRAGAGWSSRKLEPLPFDLIQEWHVARTPLTEIGKELEGEKIVHMIGDASGTLAIGITETRLFRVDIASGQIQVVGQLPGAAGWPVGEGRDLRPR